MKWNPDGKHCYVTGGSSGLGLALAMALASKGAHISVVARGAQRLADATSKLETCRQSTGQMFRSFAFDLSRPEGAQAALDAASKEYGGSAPDVVFLCAGVATPRFFVESTEQSLSDGMNLGYWTAAWTAWAVTRAMVKEGRTGKIVFVSSTLGYMSFGGWSAYSPARFAIRGLADTLSSELQLYNIDVHVFFPNTMLTPGYNEEMKTKPEITKKIEEGDTAVTPEQAAETLLTGIRRGHTHITGDLITELFRTSTRGSAPYHNFIYDCALDFVAWIGVPVWRRSADAMVRSHKDEHVRYLKERGLIRD